MVTPRKIMTMHAARVFEVAASYQEKCSAPMVGAMLTAALCGLDLHEKKSCTVRGYGESVLMGTGLGRVLQVM
jgi:hypothetical protein